METGDITIDTYPAGANVYIDGLLILDDKGEPGVTPMVITVYTGYHDIRLTLDGYCDEFDGQFALKNYNIRVYHYFNIC